MGKKIACGNDPASREIHQGRGRARHRPHPSPRQIFEQAEKFAGYGFNKGHAAAYAQVAYQTAYLKANYPVEFLAASMTLDIGNTDRLNIFRQEAQRLGVKVAAARHQPLAKRCLPAMPTPSGCSMRWPRSRAWAARRWTMWWRCARRAARSNRIGDFARRVDPRLVNKRAFENLVRAGRLRQPQHRTAASWWRIPTASWAGRRRAQRERESGQVVAVRRRRQPSRGIAPDRRCRTGRRMSGWARNSPPWAFISPAIRWMPMARR